MKRWPTKPLSEVAELYQPKTITSADILSEGPYKVFGANGVIGFYNQYNHEEPEVAVTCRGATCGTVNFTEPKCWITGNAMVVSPKDKSLDKRYLFYALKEANMNSVISGSAQPQITRQSFAPMEIAVPPLAEQERIAKLLDESNELRKLRAQANRRTAALIPALFHEMFGDPIANPNAWPVRRLDDVVTPGKIVTYGIVQAGPNIPNGIPYIRTGDLKDGVIKLEGLLRTSSEIATSYRRSEVAAGDIVMSIRATVGTTAVVPQELDGANLTQGTARISPGNDTVTDYLLWFIRMAQTQSWIQSQVKGATFREITLGNLRQLPVLLPPLPLQKQFAQRVAEIRELEASQATSRTHLDALFQSMLHRAFNGDL